MAIETEIIFEDQTGTGIGQAAQARHSVKIIMFFCYKSESIYTSIIANPTTETFFFEVVSF